MLTDRKPSFIRSFAYVPFFIILYVLQAAVLPRAPIFGVKAHVLPLAVAAAGVCGGFVTGGTAGLFAGMLTDLSYNEPTIYFTIIFCLAGLLCGYLCDTVLIRGLPAYFAVSVMTLLISGAAELARAFVTGGAAVIALSGIVLIEALFSLAFALPVYLVTRSIERID